MPHIPGHFDTERTAPAAMYRIYGTNEPYTGMVVELGGYLYTTVGGALEGNSYQLVAAQQMTPDGFEGDTPPSPLPGRRPAPLPNDGSFIRPNPNLISPIPEGGEIPRPRPRPRPTPTPGTLPDPGLESGDIITQFRVGDDSQFGGRRSYYYANSSRVPNGTALHHHTIPPRGRSNFMTQHTMDGREQDVFTSPPRSRDGGRGGSGARNNNQTTPGGNLRNNTMNQGGGSY